MNAPSRITTGLSSDWMESSPTSGLSPHLIASFYEVAKVGEGPGSYWGRIEGERGTDPVMVKAALTEASMEVVLNWQSPFESAGPESKAPALMAMLQSGALQPLIDSVNPFSSKKSSEMDLAAMRKSDSFLRQFEGRTGVTKLNSTQVFNGMPPIKIQVTALFRAWRDPKVEVEAPFDKLMEWALPVQLANDSTILSRAVEWVLGSRDSLNTLMPSKSPTRIAMQYKGRVYCPLVIESIVMPLNSPVTNAGKYASLLVPMTLCSLTAIDRKDWRDARRLEI